MAIGGSKVIQVTNIAPQATKDQMQNLFGYLGKIEDIRLYPTIRDVSCPVQSRICYIKYVDAVTVGVAQHMTNTVFIDRALIVIPITNGEIPDEYFALEMTRNGTIVPGLHASEPNLPPNVLNTVATLASGPAIVTYDPKLEASGLPPYPPLPSTYDTHKIEEIRRTVVVADIDPSIPSDAYIDFFTAAGEVKYLRQCTRISDNKLYMLVEFSDQPSIKEVLKMNGIEFYGTPVKIVHSTEAIVKPQAKSNEAAQREIEEAMTRVKEAQNLISATIDPVIGMLSKDKGRRSRSRSRGRRRRSRSRSRSRRRSRSRQRSKRSRSKSRKRTKSPERKRSKSRDRKRRSKSPSRKRSRSRSRRRSRTPTSKRKSRSKSRSKSSRRDRSRYKSKERTKSRDKSKEKEKSRSSRDRDDKDKPTTVSKDREKDRERSRGRSRGKSKDRDSKERRSDKESTAEIEEKRSSKKVTSRSPSRHKFRSRSRDRKRSRSRDKRSRSRGRRRSPSPRKSSRRSRTRSRDRKREKRDKRDRRERTPSLPKTVRNYDEEERGYDERNRRKDYNESYDTDNPRDKDSDAKSDNMDISNSP